MFSGRVKVLVTVFVGTAPLATAGWIVYNAIRTLRTPFGGTPGMARLLDCGCDVAEAIVHAEPCERDAG